jgi:hypothetical protein
MERVFSAAAVISPSTQKGPRTGHPAWGESHKLVVGSTPNGFNEFHSLYRDAWGRPDEAVALQLPTWEANLYIRPELLREEKRRDLRRFLQEYGAEFVEDDEP